MPDGEAAPSTTGQPPSDAKPFHVEADAKGAPLTVALLVPGRTRNVDVVMLDAVHGISFRGRMG